MPDSDDTKPPSDFVTFVAEDCGIDPSQAASILVEWIAAYEPLERRPICFDAHPPT